MSYIDEDEYKVIADYLGTAYAAVRDGMETSHTTNQLITDYVVQTVDDTSPVATAAAPTGSVASDLGKKYSDFGVSMSSTARLTLAASYFTGVLSALNNHILKRSGTSRRSIVDWYTDVYDFNVDYYFSDDFIELSSKINVNILTYLQGNETP